MTTLKLSRLAAFGFAVLAMTVSAQTATPPMMNVEELATGKKIYFERCAGCHGVLRKGATGKNLEPHWAKKAPDGTEQEGGTLKLGTNRLEKIIGIGTEGGMVNYDDILTKDEINIMARYIQQVPDVPPRIQLEGHAGELEVDRSRRSTAQETAEQGQPEERVCGDAARHG